MHVILYKRVVFYIKFIMFDIVLTKLSEIQNDIHLLLEQKKEKNRDVIISSLKDDIHILEQTVKIKDDEIKKYKNLLNVCKINEIYSKIKIQI